MMLRVGMRLGTTDETAFCGGAFGRSGYGPHRVEAIGADWVVVRKEDRGDVFLYEGDPERLLEYAEQPVRR